MLISYDEMKKLLIVVLIVGAACYFLDMSPLDFFPSLPNSRPVRTRHASAGPAQAPATSAQPIEQRSAPATSNPTPAAANTANGSLADRWKP